MKYNVFLFPVARVRVPVEADTAEEAITKAEAAVASIGGFAELLDTPKPASGVDYVEYDEADTGDALVEDAEDCENFSRWYECQHNAAARALALRNNDVWAWFPKDADADADADDAEEAPGGEL